MAKEIADAKTFFWPYDLFGYLLPGLVLTISVYYLDPDIKQLNSVRLNEMSYIYLGSFLVASYFAGHVIACLSSFLLERIVHNVLHGYPAAQMLAGHDRGSSKFRKVVRFLINCLVPGHCAQFSTEYTNRFIDLYKSEFGYDPNMSNRKTIPDLFWTANMYVAENQQYGFKYISHFVHMYGFLRNTAMSLFLISLTACMRSWRVDFPNGKAATPGLIAFLSLLSAYLCFINYAKMFRRHNDLVIRSFVVAASAKQKKEADTLNEHE